MRITILSGKGVGFGRRNSWQALLGIFVDERYTNTHDFDLIGCLVLKAFTWNDTDEVNGRLRNLLALVIIEMYLFASVQRHVCEETKSNLRCRQPREVTCDN